MHNQQRIVLFSIILIAAAFSRLIPHPYNMTAIGAMALWGGAVWTRQNLGIFLPIAALFLSDIVINHLVLPNTLAGFEPQAAWSGIGWTYIPFLMIAGVASRYLSVQSPWSKIVGASLIASTFFYLVSNFGSWIGQALPYPMTTGGLFAAYAAGLPFASAEIAPPFGFLMNGVVGDLGYTVVLFAFAKYLAWSEKIRKAYA